MNKKLLVLMVVFLFLGIIIYLKKYQNSTFQPTIQQNDLSSSNEITETFSGKFVSFKYPQGFSVHQSSNDVIVLNTNNSTYPYLFTFTEYSSFPIDNKTNIPMDDWYSSFGPENDKGAPLSNSEKSNRVTIADKYDSYYAFFNFSDRGESDDFFNEIDIYLNNNGKIFTVSTQKLDGSEAVKNGYSSEEVAQIKAYEEIFWKILDTFEFK